MNDHLRYSGAGEAAQRAALAAIVRSSPLLMEVLRGLRDGGLADHLLVAGAIYNLVWNRLTGRPDLTMRQMALLLTVYLKPPPHTVRGLAAALNVSKPAVVRALDRLEELGFARREEDPGDGRNVLVNRTVQGSVYLRETGDLIAAAALKAER